MSGIGFNGSVKMATPDNFKHKLPFTKFSTFDLYQFRPVFLKEMYPTEHFKVGVSDYLRASSMAGACYGTFRKKYSAFFVPYRILWNKWNDFLTGGSSGNLTFQFPTLNLQSLINSACASAVANTAHGRCLYRNMLDMWSDIGVPIRELWGSTNNADFRDVSDIKIPALRFLACQRIWFDWYRDQNLIGDDMEDVYCPKDVSGNVSVSSAAVASSFGSPVGSSSVLFYTLLAPKPVSLFKDYFTTRNVEPQRGNAAFVPVQLPSSSLNSGFGAASDNRQIYVSGDNTQVFKSSSMQPNSNDIIGMFDYNLVRIAKGTQRYLEKNNIAGGADLQQLLAHWGTAPNPAVFQKSTFIGSFDDKLNISEVVSPLDAGDSNAGEVVTRLQAVGNGNFEYTANEHGFFVIVMTIRPENVYNGGFSREFMHGVLGNGRFDFFTPELEKTGQQPVYLREQTDAILKSENAADIPWDYTNGQGFVPRYAEGKYVVDEFSGQMQTRLYDPLKISRDFGVWDSLADSDAFLSVEQTMVYGYPLSLHYDSIFKNNNTLYDHFDGWIHFDFEKDSPMHSYAAPLIEDAKGDDITLPYAGVRM